MTSVKHRQSNKRRGHSAVPADKPAQKRWRCHRRSPESPVMGRFEPMSCRIDWLGPARAVQ
jgi:hypothetical protein